MKNFFTSFFATLSALIVFILGAFVCGFLFLGFLVALGEKKPVAVQNGSYLVFDLAANIQDAPSQVEGLDQFMEAFGEKGAVWFAQGKTFAEAQTLFQADLVAKNKELTEQVQALTAANQKLRGAADPVSFSGAAPDGAPEKQGFASLIKLPGAAK